MNLSCGKTFVFYCGSSFPSASKRRDSNEAIGRGGGSVDDEQRSRLVRRKPALGRNNSFSVSERGPPIRLLNRRRKQGPPFLSGAAWSACYDFRLNESE